MTPAAAIRLQLRLRDRVERRNRVGRVRLVAGIDVSVKDGRSRAAVVVLDAATLATVEERTAERAVPFPYVPGLLSFREIPVILPAFRKLRARPDLAIVDGMGLAHPRRFGLACHLGVLLDLPTIGCGKSLFVGTHDEPARARGSSAPLVHEGETIGAAVRTQDGVNVVYASIGHRVSLATAIKWILRTSTRYRLPEPIRSADHLAGQWACPP
jgi:deoxyribonuclease V